MRVFVTGATGFIGSLVVKELKAAGHQVLGLARNDAGVAALKAAGVEVLRGDLEHHETLKSGAAQADAVINLAFNHDFSKFAESSENERRAIEAMGDAMAGTNKLLIVTSGTGLIAAGEGRPATEDDAPVASPNFPRTPELAAEAVAKRGVRVGVVRLPQVHDTKKAGLVSFLIALAREKGYVAHVGDGSARWPAVHVTDAARLYRLAVERPEAFARYNAVAEEGVTLRDITEVLGKGLKLPVRSISQGEVPAYFGWLSHFAGRDAPASSAKTQAMLGWKPSGPTMLQDLEKLEWV